MTQKEQEMSQQLFGEKSMSGQNVESEKSMGTMEAPSIGIKEGVGSLLKGLSDVVYSEGIQHFAAHGAHELAAALFSGNGSAFVMYPRDGHDDNRQDMQPDHEMERGGRSM